MLVHITIAATCLHTILVEGVRLSLNVGFASRLEIGTRHFVSVNSAGETGTTDLIKSPFSVQWTEHLTKSFVYVNDTVSVYAQGDADVFVMHECDQISFDHSDGWLVVAGNAKDPGFGCHLMISDEACDARYDYVRNDPEQNEDEALHIVKPILHQPDGMSTDEIISLFNACGSNWWYTEINLSEEDPMGYELVQPPLSRIGQYAYTRYSTGWPETREVELVRGSDLAFVGSSSSSTSVTMMGPVSIIVEGSVRSLQCMDRWRMTVSRPCMCIVTTDLVTCNSRIFVTIVIQGVFVVTEGTISGTTGPTFVKDGEDGEYGRYDRAMTPHAPITGLVTDVLERDADLLLKLSNARTHKIKELKVGPDVPTRLKVVPAPKLSLQAVTSILEAYLKAVGLFTAYIGGLLADNLGAYLVLKGKGQTYYGGISGMLVPSNSAWVTLVLAGALTGTDIVAPLAVQEKQEELAFSKAVVASGSFFGLQCDAGEVTVSSAAVAAENGFYGLDASASWPAGGTCKAYYRATTTANEYGTFHTSMVKRVKIRAVDECIVNIEDTAEGCAISKCAQAPRYNLTLRVELTDPCDKLQIQEIEIMRVSTDTDAAIDAAILTGLQTILRAINVLDTVVYIRSTSSAYEISWWVLALSGGLLVSVAILWFLTRPSVALFLPVTIRESLILSSRLAAETGCNQPYHERPITVGLNQSGERRMHLCLTDKPEGYQTGAAIEGVSINQAPIFRGDFRRRDGAKKSSVDN